MAAFGLEGRLVELKLSSTVGLESLEAAVAAELAGAMLDAGEVVSVEPVVLQHKSTAVLVLSLWVDLLQLLLRFALLERVVQQMAVFLLHVHGHGVEVLELDGLVRLGVLVLDVVLVARLPDDVCVVELLLDLWSFVVDDAGVGCYHRQEAQ